VWYYLLFQALTRDLGTYPPRIKADNYVCYRSSMTGKRSKDLSWALKNEQGFDRK
jgi:hypothetical protein